MNNFKYWLILNENVEENFNKWLEVLVQYSTKRAEKELLERLQAQQLDIFKNDFLEKLIGKDANAWSKEDKNQLHSLIPNNIKNVIKTVLSQKRGTRGESLEKYDWFAFSIGYLIVKRNYFVEDLELAIDATLKRRDSGELKADIGNKGWFVIGSEAEEHIEDYLSKQVSNRERERMRKKGETLSENEKYIRLLVKEGELSLYFLPALTATEKNTYGDYYHIDSLIPPENEIQDRHMILCKYGKGTQWCTANPKGQYHKYYSTNNIYIIHRNGVPLYQFVDCKDGKNTQFMDVKDQSVSELEGDVYELLNKYMKDNIFCYNISRAYGADELLGLSGGRSAAAYSQISLNNIKLILSNSSLTKDQAIEILNNILYYKDKNWLSSSSRDIPNRREVISSFINKLGVDDFIKTLGKGTTPNVIKNIIKDEELKQSPEKIYNIIKTSIENYPDFLTTAKYEEIYDFLHKISTSYKEKFPELVELIGDKINLLPDAYLSSLIRLDFNNLFVLLDKKTNKIDSSLMETILSHLPSYAQGIEKISYILSPWRSGVRLRSKRSLPKSVVSRTALPTKSGIKAREMKFIEFILSKDLSTGAIERLLSGNYLISGSTEEQLDKIQQIAEMIGSKRITKIKNKEIEKILDRLQKGLERKIFYSTREAGGPQQTAQPATLRMSPKSKRRASIMMSKALSELSDDEKKKLAEEKIKLKDGFIQILRKYHKKLPIEMAG